MSEMIEQLIKKKIVAIVRTSSIEGLEKTVESLYKGGVHAVEITLNSDNALKGIERIKSFSLKC